MTIYGLKTTALKMLINERQNLCNIRKTRKATLNVQASMWAPDRGLMWSRRNISHHSNKSSVGVDIRSKDYWKGCVGGPRNLKISLW